MLDIKGIEVENHKNRAGLQLADCVTSAFFEALEPNRHGDLEPGYAKRLIPLLVEIAGATSDCGLTVVPGLHATRCNAEQRAFLHECWAKKIG